MVFCYSIVNDGSKQEISAPGFGERAGVRFIVLLLLLAIVVITYNQAARYCLEQVSMPMNCCDVPFLVLYTLNSQGRQYSLKSEKASMFYTGTDALILLLVLLRFVSICI